MTCPFSVRGRPLVLKCRSKTTSRSGTCGKPANCPGETGRNLCSARRAASVSWRMGRWLCRSPRKSAFPASQTSTKTADNSTLSCALTSPAPTPRRALPTSPRASLPKKLRSSRVAYLIKIMYLAKWRAPPQALILTKAASSFLTANSAQMQAIMIHTISVRPDKPWPI